MDDLCEDVEIPIWIRNKQKWLTGLTGRTTCDDVIYALLCSDQNDEPTHNYAIFERWRDVERPLRGRTKIVKIWRSWGVDQVNVKLTMRKIDEISFSGESSRANRHRVKSRGPRESSQIPCSCRRCLKREKYTKAESIDDLYALVRSQESDIQNLYERIHDADLAINQHETELRNIAELNGQNHAKVDAKIRINRSEKNDLINYFQFVNEVRGNSCGAMCRNLNKGDNHPQDMCLCNEIEVLSKFDPDLLTNYFQTCEKIIATDEQVLKANKQLNSLKHSLNVEIAQSNGTCGDSASALNFQGDQLRLEINHVISSGVHLAREMAELTNVSNWLDKEKHERHIYETFLLGQLSYSENEVMDNDSVFGSVLDLESPNISSVSNNNNQSYVSVGFEPSLTTISYANQINIRQNTQTIHRMPENDNHPMKTRVYTDNKSRARTSNPRVVYAGNTDTDYVIVPEVTSDNKDSLKATTAHSENDTNSDTGLSSMHSDEMFPVQETLV